MKKTILTTTFLVGTLFLNGQSIITFENHALKVDEDNPMSYCEYLEPGPAGEKVNWDFSQLKFKTSFTGYLANPDATETGKRFSGKAYKTMNTELAEFDSRFYFNVSQEKIEQIGYSSADGRSQIYYSKPFVKMKCPFAFGNIYSGTFEGGFTYSGVKTGDITGNYAVEADAYGTLVLPGNSVYENTLRVRTEKSYTTQFKNSLQDVTITTYRWYNQSHRYPLLVLTEYSTKSGEVINTNFQAAYNNNAVNDIATPKVNDLTLYPNPVSSELILEIDAIGSGDLKIRIIDASGKLVRSFEREIGFAGRQQLTLSEELSGLNPSTYTLIIDNGNEQSIRNFTKIR